MDIYDPISLALGIEPIEFKHDNTIPEDAEKGYAGPPKGCEPWNKGLPKTDPRVRQRSLNAASTKKKNGFYERCGVYLPKKFGDKNHMRTPEHKARMSALAKSRYRIYKEDGTWTWGYKA